MLSITGFLTIACMGSLLIAILLPLLKNVRLLTAMGVRLLMAAALIVMVRLLIPVEIGFETSFYFTDYLPPFRDFLIETFFHIGAFPFSLFSLILLIWITGTLVYLARSITASLRFRRALFQCEVACDPTATKALFALYQQRKGRTRFRLLQTPLVKTPLLTGLIHPVIVIPDIRLQPGEWLYVLQHEMIHYDHHDLWMKLFFEGLCAIYWWNPLVHMLRTQISRTLEIYNDLELTRRMTDADKLAYLQCILNVAKQRSRPPQHAAAFAGFDQPVLEQRFRIVLDLNERQTQRQMRLSLPLLVLLMAVITMSFSFVLETEYRETEYVDYGYYPALNAENCFLIPDESGGYFIYYNGSYRGHCITHLADEIPIYQSINEVQTK